MPYFCKRKLNNASIDRSVKRCKNKARDVRGSEVSSPSFHPPRRYVPIREDAAVLRSAAEKEPARRPSPCDFDPHHIVLVFASMFLRSPPETIILILHTSLLQDLLQEL